MSDDIYSGSEVDPSAITGLPILDALVPDECPMWNERQMLSQRMLEIGQKIADPTTTWAERDRLHRYMGELIELDKLASRHDIDAKLARDLLLDRIKRALLIFAMILCVIVFSTLVSGCSRPTPSAPRRATNSLTIIHQLTPEEGTAIRGAPVELDDRLYLLAGENGPNASPNCASSTNWQTIEHTHHCPGSIVSLKLDGTDFRVEYGFTRLDDQAHTNPDGYHPYGSLTASRYDHRLYGVAQMGGSPHMEPNEIGYGTLYAFDPVTKTLETLHHFASEFRAFDGEYPMGKLAVDERGDVFGCAKSGGATSSGTVFEWSPGGAFRYSPLPGLCYGGVTLAGGLLHGTTWSGGTGGVGVYFVVDTTTLMVRIVDSFPAFRWPEHGDDNTPIQAPIAMSDGIVLSAREFGGQFGTGILAQLDPIRGIRVLREFQDIPLSAVPRFSNATGGMINGDVAEGSDGLIYGVAQYGGAAGTGGIYRLSGRNGSLFQLLYSFTDAAYPYGGVVAGSDGAVYGTTFDTNQIWRMEIPQ